MEVKKCQTKLRCDTASCRNFADVLINTESHNGKIFLCGDCFNNLLDLLIKMRKEIKSIKGK